MKIDFNPIAGVLSVYPELPGRGPYSMPASSGRPDCNCDPSSRDNGPIPSGKYYIDTNEISKPNAGVTLLRNLRGDWGSWRVPLHPYAGTVTYGRSGFFLHGGQFPGSAGCIDIGGGVFGNKLTNQLVEDLLANRNSLVPVTVTWTSLKQ